MDKIKRFSVSIEGELLDALDELVRKHKFPNRSQAIRFLVRKNQVEDAWDENRVVAGALVLVYDHHHRTLINQAMEIQHDFHDCVLSSQHIHLDHHLCFEIIALRGHASKLRHLADRLLSLKGVRHGQLMTTGME